MEIAKNRIIGLLKIIDHLDKDIDVLDLDSLNISDSKEKDDEIKLDIEEL